MLVDSYNRIVNYLRISITDKCNLRCIYCAPENNINLSHKEILSYEEIFKIIKMFSNMGINKIRITGGEPLLRKDIINFINNIKKINKIKYLSITTNGVLIKKMYNELLNSGLNSINISLDSLSQKKYIKITGGDYLNDVLEGIDLIQKPKKITVKINTVLIKNINDDEIFDFVNYAIEKKIEIRFIEKMPTFSKDNTGFISNELIFNSIIKKYKLNEVEKSVTAKRFQVENSHGIIGFINPNSHKFCDQCNKLRLSSDGKIRNCLFSNNTLNIKKMIRDNISENEIKKKIIDFVNLKDKTNNYNILKYNNKKIPMHIIGG